MRQPRIVLARHCKFIHPRNATGSVRIEAQQRRTLLVFVAAATVFAAITAALLHGEVDFADVAASAWLHVHSLPLLTRAMIATSFLGAPSTLTAVTLVIALYLGFERRLGESLTLLAVILGGNLLNFGLKHLIQRGRPVFDDPIFTLQTYSFPSGHAMGSTVFFGVLALWAGISAQLIPHRVAVCGAAAIILLVCFSRVYLGLHYVSDVSAGVVEGIAWLALCTMALRRWRSRWPALPRI
jgi:membrane-associated phospholipid phosphatase